MNFSKIIYLNFHRALGDFAYSAAFCKLLCESLPAAKIQMVIQPQFVSLLAGQSWCTPLAWNKATKDFLKLLGNIRRKEFECLIGGGHRGGRGAFLAAMSGIPVRAGRIDGLLGRLPLIYNIDLYELLDKLETKLILREPIFEVPSVLAMKQMELLDMLPEKRIGIILGASTPEKKWSNDNWINLINSLSSEYGLVLFGHGKKEQELAGEIISACGSTNILNTVGKLDLTELVATINCCTACVGNETGPIHLAVLNMIPTVSISDYQVLPLNSGGQVIPLDYDGLTWFKAVTAKGRPTHRFNSSKGRSVDLLNSIKPNRVLASLQDLLQTVEL